MNKVKKLVRKQEDLVTENAKIEILLLSKQAYVYFEYLNKEDKKSLKSIYALHASNYFREKLADIEYNV